MSVSVNKIAFKIVQEMINKSVELGIIVEKIENGATIIDAGIKARGGYLAGKYMTEVCLGGLADVSLTLDNYGGLTLPTICVASDYPSIALLGSQYAGWRISVGKYFAMGSGPARALSLKPKDLYEKINYKDESDVAVIVLEANEKPTPEAIEYIAKECKVEPKNVYAIVAPTSSVAGSTQISGRSIETGLHKFMELGMDLSKIKCGFGQAPISPIHPKFTHAMGRTNDMLLYGCTTYYEVEYDNEEELIKILEKAPSSSSSAYGRPFYEIFKEAGFDFYKIDPMLFAPAVVTVNNVKTGRIFTYGKINAEILKRSIGLSS